MFIPPDCQILIEYNKTESLLELPFYNGQVDIGLYYKYKSDWICKNGLVAHPFFVLNLNVWSAQGSAAHLQQICCSRISLK